MTGPAARRSISPGGFRGDVRVGFLVGMTAPYTTRPVAMRASLAMATAGWVMLSPMPTRPSVGRLAAPSLDEIDPVALRAGRRARLQTMLPPHHFPVPLLSSPPHIPSPPG